MKRRRKPDRFDCLDCSASTLDIGEYYMVHDHVWLRSGAAKKDGMLCIGCLETRLDRRLTVADFTDCPLNRTLKWHSARLLSRLLSDRPTLR